MNKAVYRYWIDGPIIAIEDTGQGVGIALDAQQVLQTIDEAIGPLVGKYIIYTNQCGIWGGLTYSGGTLRLYSLGTKSYEEAKKKLHSLSPTKRDDYRLLDPIPRADYQCDWLPDRYRSLR
jgi:hypothetical protein